MENFTLTEDELQQAQSRKRWFPFRDWHAVKTASACEFFDTKRKAINWARKNQPCSVYRIS